MMWYLEPWPMLFVIPVMVIMAVFMVRRVGIHGGRADPSCGFAASPREYDNAIVTPAREDPLVTLRERFARGEIDLVEFDHRVERLLRSEPRDRSSLHSTPSTRVRKGEVHD